MLLVDIEKQVEPLSQADKEQLIRDVQRMLIDENIRNNRDRLLRELINPNVVYDIDTPNITTDDSDLEAVRNPEQFDKGDDHEI